MVGCIPQCFWRIPLFSPWIFYVSSHAVVTKASGRILTIEMDWFNGTPTGNGCFLSLNQSAPTGNMCLIFNGFQWICLCFSIAIFNNKKNWDEHMKSSAAAGENCTSCSYLDLPIGGPWPRISCDEIGPYEGPSRLHLGCDMAATCDERDPPGWIHMGWFQVKKPQVAQMILVDWDWDRKVAKPNFDGLLIYCNSPKLAQTGLGLMICWILGWELKASLIRDFKMFYHYQTQDFSRTWCW